MIAIALPFVQAPTWRVDLPLIGEHPFSIFGILVVLAIIVGHRRMMNYARARSLDLTATDRLASWVLIGGFACAHWVAVLLYHPEQVAEDPWVLVMLWAGISSVGGFIGGAVAFAIFVRRRRLPALAHADALSFGLLTGFTIGRVGCTLVNDHPGAIANNWLATGPWPDGFFRYNLGLIELVALVVLCFAVYRLFDWRRAPHGRLTAVITIAYGIGRFPLDFLRAADNRYGGLTPAQFACLGFVVAGALVYSASSRSSAAREPSSEDPPQARE